MALHYISTEQCWSRVFVRFLRAWTTSDEDDHPRIQRMQEVRSVNVGSMEERMSRDGAISGCQPFGKLRHWNTGMPVHLHIVCGSFCVTEPELSSCDRPCGRLQKKFANPTLNKSIQTYPQVPTEKKSETGQTLKSYLWSSLVLLVFPF